MQRWGAVCAVVLAVLAAPSGLQALTHAAVEAIPPLASTWPGGEIRVHVSFERSGGITADGADCVSLGLDPDDDMDSFQFVCPRWTTQAVLVAQRARGELQVEHNGTVKRVGYVVPDGARGEAWVAITDDGLQTSGNVAVTRPSTWEAPWLWTAALQALAFAVFIALLALGQRLAWQAAALMLPSLLWIPLWARDAPHVAGWVLLASWAVLGVEAFGRRPRSSQAR